MINSPILSNYTIFLPFAIKSQNLEDPSKQFFSLIISFLFQIVDLSIGWSSLKPSSTIDFFAGHSNSNSCQSSFFSDLEPKINSNKLVLEKGVRPIFRK